ncbi:hypothetical protein N7478_002939 [Penicillium angulare]|uniref:uncharacterized protein n=1 Tax=Penicillium angulare TaxID=116970 RepID=UPI0025414542|nr:uncharacterized protein N7478_002939 [Penicillium angulare]KAJ5287253.1 hypothetical protein N7478_002939 [Penicillium angulare]
MCSQSTDRKRVAASSDYLDRSIERANKKHQATACLPNQQVPGFQNDTFTDEFFQAMRAKIDEVFPIETFAEERDCSINDVRDALDAVFLASLDVSLEVPQVWHEAKSVSERGKILIAKWRSSHGGIMDHTGHAGDPICITDSSNCSTPVPNSETTIRSTNSKTGLNDAWAKTTPVKPETNSYPTSDSFVTPTRNPPTKREIPTARVPVRLDVYGSYIPVHKWIDGFHKPPIGVSDDMTDEELDELIQNGYFT